MGVGGISFFRWYHDLRAAWLRLLAWTGKSNPASLGCRS